jgi:hypothetical protein
VIRSPRTVATAWVVFAAVALVVPAACSDDDDNSGDDADVTTTTTTTTEPTTSPPVVQDVTDSPRTEDYEGARDDVTDLVCEQDGTVWRVAGTVTNSTGATADYRIFTAFLDDTGETIGLLQTDLAALEPGEARPFDDELALEADELTCGLRVERTVPED